MDSYYIPVVDYQPLSGMKSYTYNNNDNGKKKACGACRVRKCKCDSSCVFADLIPYDEPHEYRDLSDRYNIKWVEGKLRELSTTNARRSFVETLLGKNDVTILEISKYMGIEVVTIDVSGGGMKRRLQPCGACREKKRECKPSSCVFAGAIPYQEPEKYQKLNKVFNIKWLEKLLLPLKDDQRVEIVNLFLSEADRLEELWHSLLLSPSPGCGNHTLQGLVCPPQEVGQHNFGLDNLLSFNQHDQVESWGGMLLS